MYYSGGGTPPCQCRYFLGWDQMGYWIRKSLIWPSAFFSLFHLTTVLISSQGLGGFHRDASKCRVVIVIPSTLHLGRSTIESNLSKALHLAEIFVVVVHFGEVLWGFVD